MALRRRATRRSHRTIVLLSALALAAPRKSLSQAGPPADSARVVVRDVGPGVVGRLLRDVLAAPHRTITLVDTGIVLARGTDVPTALVVLRGPLRLEGRVRGDVVVLGDLVLRPGAVIEGRAIAIGGVIANSALAVVRGARLEFRDETFIVARDAMGRYALDYRALAPLDVPVVSLPGIFGVRIPGYDRVNGLSLGGGPEFALDSGRVRIDPTVTYRSQLGVLDPGIGLTIERGRRTRITLDAQRTTPTNERWIYSDIVNSALAFGAGIDMRNYYRADRAELSVERDIETTTAVVTPFVGALWERSWSAERRANAMSVPYSILSRTDSIEGMRRPNPAIPGGRIGAAIAGTSVRVLRGALTANGTLRGEVAPSNGATARFAQLTLDGNATVPTFHAQRIVVFAHGVATASDSTPAQRYGYVGGGGTIPTLAPLALGGDRLVWLDTRYVVPIPVHLPFGNTPAVAARYIVGSAGVGRLPRATQNVGVRVTVGFLRFDYVVDPRDTHKHDMSFGFGLR